MENEQSPSVKDQRWLTKLGSWLRQQRPDSGLWDECSVNYGWYMTSNLPSIDTPLLFLVASTTLHPGILLAEAIRRLNTFLPDSDRIPVGVFPIHTNRKKDYGVVLRLEDFIDILTDAILPSQTEDAKSIRQEFKKLSGLEI